MSNSLEIVKNSCLFPLQRTKRKLNVQSSINLLSSYSLSDLKIKIQVEGDRFWKQNHKILVNLKCGSQS